MCIFCSIAAGTIPARRVFEDETLLAFADVNPQAPTHLLVIPKQHIGSLAETTPEHEALLGHMLQQAAAIARDASLGGGYRVVFNTGDDGGQTVPHLHLHILGGRPMGWPPG